MDHNISQQNNVQKFNIEKFYKQNYSPEYLENKSNNNNSNKICPKCHSVNDIFHLNEKLTQLLFKNKKQFLDSLNIKKICSNCLKATLNEIYKKDNIMEMEKEIYNLNEICENMSEEKLNANLRLYNIYKKLVNSFIDYIGDNNNIFLDNNDSFNIKNEEIIGIDCLLNIIDLFNKNISLIKEENFIKKKFIKEFLNEKNMIMKQNINNDEFSPESEKKKRGKNTQKDYNNCNQNENLNSNKVINLSKDFEVINNDSKRMYKLFRTKIIKKKKKKKRSKRITKKIKFIIKEK